MADRPIRKYTARGLARKLRRYAKSREKTAANSPRYEARLKAQGAADAFYTAATLVLERLRKTGVRH